LFEGREYGWCGTGEFLRKVLLSLVGGLWAMSGRIIVPFVPTPETVVRRVLTVADVKPGEIVYDLGAGDGRIIATAARDFNAKAVGVELHDSRYELIADEFA
jgi:precorrin-6B methylase 2